MDFFRRAAGRPSRLGILPGTFNPITVAHLALARAARQEVDEVVFVLPRIFPHKQYVGASFEERVEMLQNVLEKEQWCSISSTSRGLFVEIAEECRADYGPEASLWFLCGSDAAERIAGWDYGAPGAFAGMLNVFGLLVAKRQTDYFPPVEFAAAIRPIQLEGDFASVSATEVRERMAAGREWEHLVPAPIREDVRRIYSPR